MSFEFYFDWKETEAELADEQTIDILTVSRVGTVIPGATPVLAQFDTGDRFDLGHLLMSQHVCLVHALVLTIF